MASMRLRKSDLFVELLNELLEGVDLRLGSAEEVQNITVRLPPSPSVLCTYLCVGQAIRNASLCGGSQDFILSNNLQEGGWFVTSPQCCVRRNNSVLCWHSCVGSGGVTVYGGVQCGDVALRDVGSGHGGVGWGWTW